MMISLGILSATLLLALLLSVRGARSAGGSTSGTTSLEQWSVGNRGFGTILVFMLLAGEIYTTFTFLGGSGWAYGRGAPAPDDTSEYSIVAQFGGGAIVGLGADYYRVKVRFCHRREIHSHQCGKSRATSFNHPQVGQIMHHATAIGIKKHHLFAGRQLWYLFHHSATVTKITHFCNILL